MGREMTRREKKSYSTPRIVDFGAIEVMTGECIGTCIDGANGAGLGE